MRPVRVLLTTGVLLVAAVAAILTVLLVRHHDGADPADAAEEPHLSVAEQIACARLLGEVEVLGSVKNVDDQVLLTVRVTTYLQPPGGPKKVQVIVTDPGLAEHGLKPWAAGTTGLLLVPSAHRYPATMFTGADLDPALASYGAHLDEGLAMACPEKFQ